MSTVHFTPTFLIIAPPHADEFMDDLLTPLLHSALTNFATEEARALMHGRNTPSNTCVSIGMSRQYLKKIEPALNKDLKSLFYNTQDGANKFKWEPSVTVDINADFLELSCKRDRHGAIKCVMTPIQVAVNTSPKHTTPGRRPP